MGFRASGAFLALEVVLLAVALVVVPRDRRPSSALAWILLFVLLPVIGALLFAVIGNPKLPAARRAKQRTMDERIAERAREAGPVSDDHETPPWLPSVARLNENLAAMPLLEDNDAHLLPHFAEQLAALVDAVHGARRYVHVEFYILSLDATTAPFFAALEDAVARGVQVRVLLDHLGSRSYPEYRATTRELTRIGAQWHLMLPVLPLRGRYQRPDLRNHRKLLVADGEVGFVGSLNLIDPSYLKRANRRRGLVWRDLMVRVHGPAVHEVDALFVTDWFSETDELLATSREQASADQRGGDLLCQVAPSGPGFEVENNLALFNTLIHYAQRRLSITSPYFVPDESLLVALTTAARRGVAVELFVSEIGDQFFVYHSQHSYYQALLDAGVRIWLYPAPSILHAKHLSVDELVTVVGSSNMDMRSLNLNLELMLMTCGKAFADEMRAVEDEYRALSRELTPEEWSRRSFGHRLVDDLTRLTSAVQ
ncbi:cardiolipin synthase [Quadrisphaera sp. DSM 44207]|uniref:cardiolipin synthase n=1 Tax=Quadrisphaera sp. DSM 44207 TaxID=1881057 RepID=UPI0021019518|nr:cardiolipin synthase [Quadrisphaera sp. DSM 44207]